MIVAVVPVNVIDMTPLKQLSDKRLSNKAMYQECLCSYLPRRTVTQMNFLVR